MWPRGAGLPPDLLLPPQTSMKNMEKELLCPVCQEMYKQPLVLPCTHNVCQACAREVLGQQGYVGPGGDPSSEPTSPASTPSTRSPRLPRRAAPKPDRLDRLLKSGGPGCCGPRAGTPGRRRGAGASADPAPPGSSGQNGRFDGTDPLPPPLAPPQALGRIPGGSEGLCTPRWSCSRARPARATWNWGSGAWRGCSGT